MGKSGGLAVTKDGGEIDALTGATITSRGSYRRREYARWSPPRKAWAEEEMKHEC